ncbi:hypothetical protein TWF730_002766 [Orbilia blumenaviensis]|uniref:Capsule polysaccharide biosynthesis protein n=1 Tax=Orbilia blumenaviensis TaxID=1796055 RepID=A0AAV9UAJ6_9PEZI
MSAFKFSVPSELSSQLQHVQSLDSRTDDEIISSLSTLSPVTSEKNIWAYWHSGLSSIPPWCQRNIINWSRLCGPTWNIHVLDNVPSSPNYVLKWVEPTYLPEAFVNNTMDGPYVGPHSADFLRGACLYKYGGVYMDVGIILFRSLDSICWDRLSDPSSPYQISVPWMYGSVMANHFVASRKSDPFIKAWHDLFVHLWKGRKNHQGIGLDPLVAFCQTLDFGDAERRGFKWEFKVDPFTVMQYIGQVISWLRLCIIDGGDTGEINWAEYAKEKIFWYDVLEENFGAETVVGFTGQPLYDALATKLDADKESEEYKTAYKLVWRLLTRSSMQKITHGKDLTKTPALGLLWDLEENRDKDVEPGTFAELLRYGSVHFEQTRVVKAVDYSVPTELLHKGVFEP